MVVIQFYAICFVLAHLSFYSYSLFSHLIPLLSHRHIIDYHFVLYVRISTESPVTKYDLNHGHSLSAIERYNLLYKNDHAKKIYRVTEIEYRIIEDNRTVCVCVMCDVYARVSNSLFYLVVDQIWFFCIFFFLKSR